MARKNSRFVYARPSFIEGMARVLDLGGTLNVYHNLPAGEPAGPLDTVAALRKHWVAVGEHMRCAIGEWEAIERDELPVAGRSGE